MYIKNSNRSSIQKHWIWASTLNMTKKSQLLADYLKNYHTGKLNI